MAERAGEQLSVGRRQEHDAAVGQAGDHQLDDLVEQFVPVPGGGDQRPGPHQERQPFPGAAGLGPRGAVAGQQFGPFLLGALAGGQVDDERRPAQRVAVDHRRPDQDRHPVPVPVHVLLLERLARAGLPQLLHRPVVDAAHSGGVIVRQATAPASRSSRL